MGSGHPAPPQSLVAMEDAQENPAESSSSAPVSEEPASLARGSQVLPPEESTVCTRPLEAAPKKLCGYLSKLGGKRPIRGWKSRWFFYDERKCHLYYSRTAQDANPLDSIDLSCAVFDCKADAEEGTFEIKTPSRTITLKAATKQAMLYWLQQLQTKRWEFHNSPPAPPATPDAVLAGNGPALRLELEIQCTTSGATSKPKEQARDPQEKILHQARSFRGRNSPLTPGPQGKIQEILPSLHPSSL